MGIYIAKDLNKVLLIGNLGKDPEVRFTSSGVPVASFSIATNKSWKDAEGNLQERTDWHNIVAWRKLAEICGEWLKKGSRIYCEGEIITRSYDDKNTGVKKYTTEIVINDMIMLSPKTAGATGGSSPAASAGSAPAASGPAVDDLPF